MPIANALWNDYTIGLLRRLWAEGCSASQISGRIPGATRSAIIGKVHRLGLTKRRKRPEPCHQSHRRNRVATARRCFSSAARTANGRSAILGTLIFISAARQWRAKGLTAQRMRRWRAVSLWEESMSNRILSEQVRVTFDRATHERLRMIAHREGKSLTGLVRELAEKRAEPIEVTVRPEAR